MSDSTTVDREQEMVIGGDSADVGSAPSYAQSQPSGNGSHARAGRTVAGESISDEYAGMDIVSTVDDVDEASFPRQITAARLNQFVAENPDLHPIWKFHLHQTSIQMGDPFYAQVRIVNLTDKTLIGTLPQEVRRLIENLFFAGQVDQRGKKKGAEQRMAEGLSRIKQIGYAYGCAGFVDPKLVLRPEDVRDPEKEVWVGAIQLHDLTEFSRICEGDDALAARRLEGFSVE